MKYAVIYEKSLNGWGAFIPDLPGCVALGFTFEEAVQAPVCAMREDGDPIPEPSHVANMMTLPE